MNKKLLLTIVMISTLGLSGCFGGEDTSGSGQEVVGTKKNYDSPEFSMQIPLDWDIIESDRFTSNVPSGTLAAFVNNVKSDRFTANVNVNTIQFTEEVSLEDFAQSSMQQARSTLTGFTEGTMEEVNVNLAEGSLPGIYLTFSGKRNASDPIIMWQQIVVIQNDIGYTVSGAYLSDESESVVKQVGEMLNSLALK